MGAVSPLGCGVETNWSRLLAGRSGIRTLPEAITADLSARVGGQVPDVSINHGKRKNDALSSLTLVATVPSLIRGHASASFGI